MKISIAILPLFLITIAEARPLRAQGSSNKHAKNNNGGEAEKEEQIQRRMKGHGGGACQADCAHNCKGQGPSCVRDCVAGCKTASSF